MAYVYRHIRLDKMQPFYIGIGKEINRAYCNTDRNKHWHNIAKKGYKVQILFDDLSWQKACEKEKELIAIYGRVDNKTGILCNMTDGGDGNNGLIFTEEHRKKISIAGKGRVVSEEAKLKLSIYNTGKKLSKEHRHKISLGKQNISDQTREKISNSRKGTKASDETKLKMSTTRKGIKYSSGNNRKVFDTLTNTTYNNIKEASEKIGMPYYSLSNRLRGIIKNDTTFIFQAENE
jgi:hypothetical protein